MHPDKEAKREFRKNSRSNVLIKITNHNTEGLYHVEMDEETYPVFDAFRLFKDHHIFIIFVFIVVFQIYIFKFILTLKKQKSQIANFKLYYIYYNY